MNYLLHNHPGYLLILLIVIGGLFYFIFTRKLPPDSFSNWHQLFDGMKLSTQEFYTRLEANLKSHQIEDITFKRVELSEKGFFSSKREYLRVQWKEYTHDIGAFPFATGFYITSWQYKQETGLEAILRRVPMFGTALHRLFFPITYYTFDTATMYLSFVQQSLLTIVDALTKEQGLRSLSESERKPQMENIFKRK